MKKIMLFIFFICALSITTGCMQNVTKTNDSPIERVEAEILTTEGLSTVQVGFKIEDEYQVVTFIDNNLTFDVRRNNVEKIIIYVRIINGEYSPISWKKADEK